MTDQQPHRVLEAATWRSSKSETVEAAIMALVRAGRTVTIVRPGSTTKILPFKRPAR